MKIAYKHKNSTLSTLKRIFFITLGSLISSASINLFIIPAKLLSGGITGIAILANYAAHINTGLLVFVLNIPLFILALKFVDKQFTFYSLLGMATSSIFLSLTSGLASLNITNDILLASIFGGILSGIGGGMVMRQRACQGGTDILAVILNDKVEFSVATLGFGLSGIVVFVGMFIVSVQAGLYTVISMYIGSIFCNKIIDGIERKRMLLAVTENSKEVAEAITSTLGRGVTLLHGEGAYTETEKNTVYCVVTVAQLSIAISLIKDIDKTAFITVADVSEVHGKGFRKPVF